MLHEFPISKHNVPSPRLCHPPPPPPSPPHPTPLLPSAPSPHSPDSNLTPLFEPLFRVTMNHLPAHESAVKGHCITIVVFALSTCSVYSSPQKIINSLSTPSQQVPATSLLLILSLLPLQTQTQTAPDYRVITSSLICNSLLVRIIYASCSSHSITVPVCDHTGENLHDHAANYEDTENMRGTYVMTSVTS